MIGYHGSDETITQIHAGTGNGLYLATEHADAAAYGTVVHTIELADTAQIADWQDLEEAIEATRWIDQDAGVALYDPNEYTTWEIVEMTEIRDHLAATYDGIELEDVNPDGDDHDAILVWNTALLTIKDTPEADLRVSTEGTQYTISYDIAAYSAQDEPSHCFQAITTTGDIASELYVDMTTLVIENIETAEQYRREGIASALFAAAEAQLPEVLHSRPAHRTEEGHGWAEAVGGDTEDIEDEEEDEDEDPWN